MPGPSWRRLDRALMPAAAGSLLVLASLAPLARPARAAPPPGMQLPFIEDDYPAARAAARKRGLPLFVDAWAPWCHSCQSLRQYVFTDPALAPWKDRFVWASIDTEKDVNAAFVAAHPIAAWPTLFVLDPESGATRASWEGALMVRELEGWLTQATRAGGKADAKDEAKDAAGGARERAAEAAVSQLLRDGDNAGCVRTARAELGRLAPGTSRLNVAIEGLACADSTPAASAEHAAGVPLAQAIVTMIEDARFPILPDDRSSGYDALVASAEAAKDGPRARTLAARWLKLLDESAARARTPAARAVFDSHRVGAALAAGDPAHVIPALRESARDFPKDYNPPARLARLYLAAGDLGQARAHIDRAMTLVYGPRRRRLEELRDKIAAAERQAAGRRIPADPPFLE